jgi:hypothetical protein
MSGENTVYQVSALPKDKPFDRPMVLAMTSKQSAQKLIAALKEQETAYRYKISTFECPNLPGMEH